MKNQTPPAPTETDNRLGSLGARFRAEVLAPAGITWEEVARHDPQEMAIFCFLVGAGIHWADAIMAENLDLPNDQRHPFGRERQPDEAPNHTPTNDR